MSLLVGALAASVKAQDAWQVTKNPLTTPWTKRVSPQNALPEYPRPQLTRRQCVLAASVTGYTGDYKTVAISPAARATLKPGNNMFAVHVHQTIGGQSIDVGIAKAP